MSDAEQEDPWEVEEEATSQDTSTEEERQCAKSSILKAQRYALQGVYIPRNGDVESFAGLSKGCSKAGAASCQTALGKSEDATPGSRNFKNCTYAFRTTVTF